MSPRKRNNKLPQATGTECEIPFLSSAQKNRHVMYTGNGNRTRISMRDQDQSYWIIPDSLVTLMNCSARSRLMHVFLILEAGNIFLRTYDQVKYDLLLQK
jgi:hypothetical protein